MTLASISTKTQTILGHCFGKKGEGRFFQVPRSRVYAVPVTEDAHSHRETDTVRCIYTTQCTSHYSPLSHNDRYLLASHSRPIPLIWTDSAMPTNDLYQLRLLQMINWLLQRLRLQLCGYSSNTRFNSFYPKWLDTTRRHSFEVLCSDSLLRNYKVLLDTSYN